MSRRMLENYAMIGNRDIGSCWGKGKSGKRRRYFGLLTGVRYVSYVVSSHAEFGMGPRFCLARFYAHHATFPRTGNIDVVRWP